MGRRFRVVVFLLALVVCPAVGTADESTEVPPVIPGPDSKKPLPDAVGIATLEMQRAATRSTTFEYTKAVVERAKEKGGKGASGFDRAMAILHGALVECGLYFNRESFKALPVIYGHDPEAAPGFLDKVLTVSIVLSRRRVQTGSVKLGSAYGRLAHAWGRMLSGQSVDLKRVLPAAEVVKKGVKGQEHPADAWRDFVGAALRAGERAGHEELGVWARAEAKRLVKVHPEDKAYQSMASAAELIEAISLSRADSKEGRSRLKTLLRPLAAKKAIADSDTALIGIYNRAVTAGRLVKPPLKFSYRMKTFHTATQLLHLDLPIGTGWEAKEVDGKKEEGEWVRKNRAGKELLTLRAWKYDTSVKFKSVSGNVTSGDNLELRAHVFLEAAKGEMAKVTKTRPKLGRLSKGVQVGKSYEVRGELESGAHLAVREWFFKTKEVTGWVMVVSMRTIGKKPKKDPELDTVLASIRETLEPPRR